MEFHMKQENNLFIVHVSDIYLLKLKILFEKRFINILINERLADKIKIV